MTRDERNPPSWATLPPKNNRPRLWGSPVLSGAAFRIVAVVLMFPLFFAIGQLKHGHSLVGTASLLVWVPVVGRFMIWMHEKDYASLRVTAPAVLFVVGLTVYFAATVPAAKW